MPRPKRQHARRELIIEAAGRAIGDRGLAGVRIRDIAERAGLSAGSVLYYYPEMADLMVEVHSATVSAFYRAREDRVAAASDPVARLVAAVWSGLPTGPDDATCRLLYEMHTLADRSAPHAALMAGLFDREVALYRSVLDLGVGLGAFRPACPVGEIARTAVGLEDGLGLHVLSRNRSVTTESAAASMLSCLAVLVQAELSAA